MNADTVDREAPFRFLVEFGIATIIAVVLVRNFVAETYSVPSGSMATALLGHHVEARCPACRLQFDVGVDDTGHMADETTCPNCLYPHIPLDTLPPAAGDRLLVQKATFDYRPPRRWEPAVFRHPQLTREAWIKRVVGLPNESVEIFAGDVYIDGAIARKDWQEYLACRVSVYQLRFMPADPALPLPARFVPVVANSACKVERSQITFVPTPQKLERIEYVHRDKGALERAIRDELPYNADQPHWLLEDVGDLSVSATFHVTADTPAKGMLRFGLRATPEREVAAVFDFAAQTVRLEGPAVAGIEAGRLTTTWQAGAGRLDLAFVDRAVWLRVNDRELLGPIELDGRRATQRPIKVAHSRPLYIEASTAVSITDLRVDRDIHYGSRVEGAVHSSAIGRPCQLGADEFFVLGDNSAISRDSRAWDAPAVPRRFLIGKPLFAHLPGKIETTTLIGRTIRKPNWPIRRFRCVP